MKKEKIIKKAIKYGAFYNKELDVLDISMLEGKKAKKIVKLIDKNNKEFYFGGYK